MFFSRLFKEFSEVIQGIFLGYLRNFPKLFKEFSQIIQGIFQGYSRTQVIQGIFLCYSGNFPRFLDIGIGIGIGIGTLRNMDDNITYMYYKIYGQ